MMRWRFCFWILLTPIFAAFSTPSAAYYQTDVVNSPRLFFTDLESGPNSGGENNLGVFVTLYGEGFGSARGDSIVTVGGHEVAAYSVWGEDNAPRSLDMIVFQPGPDVTSGDIVLTVNGAASNPLPFVVRQGNIFFVLTTGNDTNSGSFEHPWQTVAYAKNAMAEGDTVYIGDGVYETAEENFSAVLSVEVSGAEGAPRALVAYPGATAAIGSTALEFGIRVPNIGIHPNDWVIAKLVLRGRVQALDIGGSGSSRWRIVGNDISCPMGDGQTGCFAAALASHIAFLGNEVHDISREGSQPSKQYHAIYFTTDTNHVEVGWNHIHDNLTCRAVQFHSSPLNETTGYNQYDLIVHDNLIHGDVCDGINFATVDPSQGPVRAFNNIIYDVGRGPSPPDGDANYTCIYVAGGTNNGAEGEGGIEIYNNTLFNCGARKLLPNSVGDEGAVGRAPGSPNLFMTLINNIIYALDGEAYVSLSSNVSLIRGSHNLWFGGGDAPPFLTDNLTRDPMFVDLPSFDFRLQPSSPAIDAGIDLAIESDYRGTARLPGAHIDLGAYEARG